MPARTFGQNTEKSCASRLAPWPTHRVTTAPRRLPAFRIWRRYSERSLLLLSVSASSNQSVGASFSIIRKSAASETFDARRGSDATSSRHSSRRVFPHRGAGLVITR